MILIPNNGSRLKESACCLFTSESYNCMRLSIFGAELSRLRQSITGGSGMWGNLLRRHEPKILREARTLGSAWCYPSLVQVP